MFVSCLVNNKALKFLLVSIYLLEIQYMLLHGYFIFSFFGSLFVCEAVSPLAQSFTIFVYICLLISIFWLFFLLVVQISETLAWTVILVFVKQKFYVPVKVQLSQFFRFPCSPNACLLSYLEPKLTLGVENCDKHLMCRLR